MKRPRDIDRIRMVLVKRRRDLLETALAAKDEVDALKAQGRDAEFEENAQVDLADYTLSSLMETQRRELQLIDAALVRMDQGNFGECIDCGIQIPFERLMALPFAVRCGEDAAEYEQKNRGRPARETATVL